MNPDFKAHRATWLDSLQHSMATAEGVSDRSYWLHEIEAFNRTFDNPWPDTGTLVMPRNDEGLPVDPVLEVLSEIAKPYGLAPVYANLRLGGMNIPHKAEAEIAAAIHYMMGFALRDGADWRRTMVADLRIHRARGLEANGLPPDSEETPQ